MRVLSTVFDAAICPQKPVAILVEEAEAVQLLCDTRFWCIMYCIDLY